MDTLLLSERYCDLTSGKPLYLKIIWNYLHFPPLLLFQLKKEVTMDKEHVKGAADKAKGVIKDAAGKVTGDKKLQAEGKIDKAKGAAHNVAGDVKDAARDASKEAKKD
jgi:uncharacterized protein YjbJ (UPF0337 family)